MKKNIAPSLPRMRTKGLVIDDLPDEVLVYDLDRHKAHCLNRSASVVWRKCNGRSQPREIARSVQAELDEPFNEDLVWLALRQLDQNYLLEEPIALPPKLIGLSRREMVRALGLAAVVAVPVVTSIVAPTAVQAVSCFHATHVCQNNGDCCSNNCSGSGGNKVCIGG